MCVVIMAIIITRLGVCRRGEGGDEDVWLTQKFSFFLGNRHHSQQKEAKSILFFFFLNSKLAAKQSIIIVVCTCV